MEILFRRPELDDRETILKHLSERRLRGCERTFANVYLWARFYNEGWAEIEGTAVFRTGPEGAYSYTYPIGAGDRKKVVELLMQDAQEKGYPFQLHALSTGEMNELESYFPGKFQPDTVGFSSFLPTINSMISSTFVSSLWRVLIPHSLLEFGVGD